MRLNPIIIAFTVLLAGCQGVSSATDNEKEDTPPITVKFAPYSFKDGAHRESNAKSVRENPDLRDLYEGNYIGAYGTWTSRTPLGAPYHSVEITCTKDEGMIPFAHSSRDFRTKGLCIVAKATIDVEGGLGQKNFLSANTNFYDITKWDFDEIVAVGSEESYDCYKEELKFDRRNETVTLLRTTISGGTCFGEPEKEPLLLTLGCPPSPWPLKNEPYTYEGQTYMRYCLPDVDKMTEEQREAFATSP